MKSLLLNLWAWVLVHPVEVLGALYVVLNVINKTIPVERRKASLALRVLDRLCVLTQRSAANGASWPVFGKSLAKEIVSASLGDRETQAPPPPSDPPSSEPGFAESRVLAVIAALCIVALAWLTGCASAVPHVQAIPPTIRERPEYGTCAETGGKIEVAQAGVVSLLTSVCWRPMGADAGVSAADASAPEPAPENVPDKADAAVSE